MYRRHMYKKYVGGVKGTGGFAVSKVEFLYDGSMTKSRSEKQPAKAAKAAKPAKAAKAATAKPSKAEKPAKATKAAKAAEGAGDGSEPRQQEG